MNYSTEISNIPVDCFNNLDEAVNYILVFGRNKTAVAINPEKILASIDSEQAREALLSADIRYLDGIGAVKVAEKKSSRKINRIPGCELWESLMKNSIHYKQSVFLLGATNDVVTATKAKLESEFDVNVIGFQDGFFTDESAVIQKILSLRPDILTVAMGSPRQEVFMQKCRDAGVESFMMGVGGSYNVFVGAATRAPEIWCKLNLEWFYRLIKEPKRIFRQLRLLRFIWLALTHKL